MLSSFLRHLRLRHGRKLARIIDHVLALRFLGLDCVCIVIERGSRVPYFGNGMPYLRSVLDALQPDGYLQRCTLTNTAIPRIKNPRKLLVFEPRSDERLQIKVGIDYGNDKRIFSGEHRYVVNEETILECAEAKGLGEYEWTKLLIEWLHGMRWPHANEFVWRGQIDPQVLGKTLARHRVWDLLGALSVSVPAGCMPEGSITTTLAGHTEDLLLNRAIGIVGWRDISSARKAA